MGYHNVYVVVAIYIAVVVDGNPNTIPSFVSCNGHPCELMCGGQSVKGASSTSWYDARGTLVGAYRAPYSVNTNDIAVTPADGFTYLSDTKLTYVAVNDRVLTCTVYENATRRATIVYHKIHVTVAYSSRFCIIGYPCVVPLMPNDLMGIMKATYARWLLDGMIVLDQGSQSKLRFTNFQKAASGRYVSLGSDGSVLNAAHVPFTTVSSILRVDAVVLKQYACYMRLPCGSDMNTVGTWRKYSPDGVGKAPLRTCEKCNGVIDRFVEKDIGLYYLEGSGIVYNLTVKAAPVRTYFKCVPPKSCAITCAGGRLVDQWSGINIVSNSMTVADSIGWYGVGFYCIIPYGVDSLIFVNVTNAVETMRPAAAPIGSTASHIAVVSTTIAPVAIVTTTTAIITVSNNDTIGTILPSNTTVDISPLSIPFSVVLIGITTVAVVVIIVIVVVWCIMSILLQGTEQRSVKLHMAEDGESMMMGNDVVFESVGEDELIVLETVREDELIVLEAVGEDELIVLEAVGGDERIAFETVGRDERNVSEIVGGNECIVSETGGGDDCMPNDI